LALAAHSHKTVGRHAGGNALAGGGGVAALRPESSAVSILVCMMLSLTRQTVNELLRQMEKESIIECERGGVRVLDSGRLREAAQTSIPS
jgi:Crp-like helix-turn-helix domain